MSAVPAEAVTAAQEAFAKVYNDPVTLSGCLAAALEAAAPLIAAAERDRIRQLAIEHVANAKVKDPSRQFGEKWVSFAELLDGQP